ncbi:MAG: ABC transporter ATP-binding protein [Mycobacteriaceae bacterium]
MSTPEQPSSSSAVASLRRLGPYVRLVRRPMLISGAAALGASAAGLVIPLITQHVVDTIAAGRGLRALLPLLSLALVVGAAEAVLIKVRRHVIARPTATLEKRMRDDLYAHLQRLPVAFHDRWQGGQLLSRAVSDLTTIRLFVAFGAIFMVVNGLTVVIGAVILVVLWPPFGFVALGLIVPMVLLSTIFEGRYKHVARRSQDQVGDLATKVEESVLGVRVLKAFGRGPRFTERFRTESRSLWHTEMTKIRILAVLWAAIIALPEIAVGATLLLGGIGVGQGHLSLGTLVAAVTTVVYLQWPIDSLGWLLAEANKAASATDRYWDVRDTVSAVQTPTRPRVLPTPARGALSLRDVHFTYPDSDTPVLRGVDLEVAAGETVALVGLTGSGKTTLTALVPRLYDVTAGAVLLDGVDVRELSTDTVRRHVATAFEDPVLFSASVRENVALGPVQASDDDVREALEVAHCWEFVSALPWGMDTRIGEQGLSLSGGQRQRLALARAVLGRPAVLVLDDPLSALDVHTEAEVERALKQVLVGVTSLVVAHRPSTVALADRVALLQDGLITAIGTHHELLASSEAYRHVISTEESASPAGAGQVGAR